VYGIVKKLTSILHSRAVYSAVVVCAYLLLVFAMIVPGTASRYDSDASGSDTAAVAKFQVTSTNGDSIFVLTDVAPGIIGTRESPEPAAIPHEITLHNRSDVTVAYRVSCHSYGNLPLEFSISNAIGTMAAGADSEKITITITWPADKNDVSYASEVDVIWVTVSCEQVD
jgi:hypothetical protein